jgi:hypothetical protein
MTSVFIDTVCRKLAQKYITNTQNFAQQIEAKDEAFDNFFHEKLFYSAPMHS